MTIFMTSSKPVKTSMEAGSHELPATEDFSNFVSEKIENKFSD